MNPLQPLARYARSRPGAGASSGPASAASDPCEMCGLPLDQGHRHVLEPQRQALLCVCRACALLFSDQGGTARFQTIGDRVLVDPSLRISDDLWGRLQIPVRLAFITWDAGLDQWQATYPSVAGPTRSELAPEQAAPLRALPLVRALNPGVEALLVYGRMHQPLEPFGVAVDRCYALVGMLRRLWRGFSGGSEVWREVDSFFAELHARARPLGPRDGSP